MGGPRAVRVALAGLLVAASAACNSSASDADRTTPAANTVRTEPAPTTTTNPYAVPAVIDEAYVNRVLAGLDAVAGDAVRIVYQTRTIPAEALARLTAIYASPAPLQLFIDGLQLDMQSGFKNYRPQIGNRSSLVTQLVTAERDCIFAQVRRDYSAVGVDSSAVVNPQWVGLERSDPRRDANHYNPTAWAYTYDGFTRDRLQPQNPCAR